MDRTTIDRPTFAPLSGGSLTSYPLYKEVQIRLTQCLVDQEWKPGEAIPSEARLAKRFNVSIGTIRKALDEMVAENILVRHQGRGTFVATHNMARNVYYFFKLTRNDGYREGPSGRVISFQRVKADAETANALQLGKGASIYKILHVHLLAGRPVAVNDIRLPATLFSRMTESIFSNRGDNTIYGMYQERFGINVIRTVEKLRATKADAVVEQLLGIAAGEPVLQIDRVAYTFKDQPVEFRRSFANTEDYYYLNDSDKK